MRLIVVVTFLLCLCANTYAQEKKAFPKHEFGANAGITAYQIAYLLSPSTDDYTIAHFGVDYHFRPLRHLQIGMHAEAGGDIGGTGGSAIAAELRMSFPIGRNDAYFYPGWHLVYNHIEEVSLGIGIHLGGCIPVNDLLAITVEGRGSVLLFGVRGGISTGVRVRI